MNDNPIQRRAVVAAGGGLLISALSMPSIAGTVSTSGLSQQNSAAIHHYYAAWEQKSWQPIDRLLAADFTFTSANNDDHIDKSTFKERCWKSQIDFIKRFDLQQVIGSANDAFVLYVGHTTSDKTFRNVEYLQLREGKIHSIECYFGEQSSFPSAASSRRD